MSTLRPSCPHGVSAERLYHEGCAKCDNESRVASQARAFRARVVSTARLLMPACVVLAGATNESPDLVMAAFRCAEEFERAADEYEQNGGKA